MFSWKNLTQRLFGTSTSTTAKSRRPGLEVLEDRLTPADVLVTNASNTGPGSFRAALGNYVEGDTIKFQIPNPNSTVLTIELAKALPEITKAVTIDATQNEGYTAGKPVVRLSDTAMIEIGLDITAGNSTVQGLMITGFDEAGIRLGPHGGNKIYSNYIGTDGTDALSNKVGIEVNSSSNHIGDKDKGNVISGNEDVGVSVRSHVGEIISNVIRNNYIGTNAKGDASVANGTGIQIGAAAGTVGDTTIGGVPVDGVPTQNVISGNLESGVDIIAGTHHTRISSNVIGLQAEEPFPLGNGEHGVRLRWGSQHITVGGVFEKVGNDPGNVISGNGGHGVLIDARYLDEELDPIGDPARWNKILGNHIGTDYTGTLERANGGYGVVIDDAEWTEVGSGAEEGRNVISGNALGGVRILGSAFSFVAGNYIGLGDNGSDPIGNGGDGVEITTGATGKSVWSVVSGNVISSNAESGVVISGSATQQSLVGGNLIGLNAAGDTARGNGKYGVEVVSASKTVVGGSKASGNVISANGQGGIAITGVSGAFASETTVKGNLIGTNKGNTTTLGNAFVGVFISGAVDTQIGGVQDDYGNVIAGTKAGAGSYHAGRGHGISVFGSAAGTIIQGNWVGVGGAVGKDNMGNAGHGLFVSVGSSMGVLIGGSDRTLGNTIGHNGFSEEGGQPGGYEGVDITGDDVTLDFNWVGFDAVNQEAKNIGGQKTGGGTWTANNKIYVP